MHYRTVGAHLETFLAQTVEGGGGTGLPAFVRREFEGHLRCGILEHDFARVRCAGCAFERLVPFSFKGRGSCPRGRGRRMTERAADYACGSRVRRFMERPRGEPGPPGRREIMPGLPPARHGRQDRTATYSPQRRQQPRCHAGRGLANRT